MPLLSGGGVLGHYEEFKADRLAVLARAAMEHPEACAMVFLGLRVVFFNSPRLANEVLVEKAASFEKSGALKTALFPLAGNGIFTSNGPLWRKQRKLIAPIFSKGHLGAYADEIAASTTRCVERWTDGAVIDGARETTRIAMEIAARTLFGTETVEETDALADALGTALLWSNQAIGSLAVLSQVRARSVLDRLAPHAPRSWRGRLSELSSALDSPLPGLGPRRGELDQALAVLDARIARMIAERRASGLDRPDLLTKLLLARDEDDGSAMSDRQVRDELLTLFVAGHETTAAALAWSLYLVSQDREVERRLAEEAASLGRLPRAEDVQRLPYTTQIFKEALRLYPPIFMMGRDTVEDVTIGPYEIPRGTLVFVSPYVIHRLESVWPVPGRFDPDRFRPEAEASRPRQAYIPFGAGPRVCVGNNFALLEGAIILATLAQRSRLELVPGQVVEADAETTLRPKAGVWMRVRLSGTAH